MTRYTWSPCLRFGAKPLVLSLSLGLSALPLWAQGADPLPPAEAPPAVEAEPLPQAAPLPGAVEEQDSSEEDTSFEDAEDMEESEDAAGETVPVEQPEPSIEPASPLRTPTPRNRNLSQDEHHAHHVEAAPGPDEKPISTLLDNPPPAGRKASAGSYSATLPEFSTEPLVYQGGAERSSDLAGSRLAELQRFRRTVYGASQILLAAQMATDEGPGKGPEEAVQHLQKILTFELPPEPGKPAFPPRTVSLGDVLQPGDQASAEEADRYAEFLEGLTQGLAEVVRDETPGGLVYTRFDSLQAQRYWEWKRNVNRKLRVFVHSLPEAQRKTLPKIDNESQLARVYTGCLAVLEVACRVAEGRGAGDAAPPWNYPSVQTSGDPGPHSASVARRAVLGFVQALVNGDPGDVVHKRLDFSPGLSQGLSTGAAGLFLLFALFATVAMLLEGGVEDHHHVEVEDPLEKMAD